MILDEPDFDMICKEHINFVANKLIKLNPDNKLAGKYLKDIKVNEWMQCNKFINY